MELWNIKNDLYKMNISVFWKQHTHTLNRFPITWIVNAASLPSLFFPLTLPLYPNARRQQVLQLHVRPTSYKKKIPGGTTPCHDVTHCVNLTQHLAPCSPNTINNTNKHCNYVKVVVRSTGSSHGGVSCHDRAWRRSSLMISCRKHNYLVLGEWALGQYPTRHM